jgi:hypothetical protein
VRDMLVMLCGPADEGQGYHWAPGNFEGGQKALDMEIDGTNILRPPELSRKQCITSLPLVRFSLSWLFLRGRKDLLRIPDGQLHLVSTTGKCFLV